MKNNKYKRLFNESKKELFIILSSVLVYIIFHTPINILINDFLVNPILKYVYSNKWYNDLVFLLFVFFISYNAFKHRKKQYYINKIFAILISIGIIYSINRFLNLWVFHQTFLVKQIYYSDILIFITILISFLIIKTLFIKIQETENYDDGFITDKPIENIEDDKLQYSIYAEIITNKILKTQAEKSFAIGINGKWGTGKTSFINLIKKNIKNNGISLITLDYNPWNTESPNAIITDFFETFEEKLSEFNSNISSQVNKYSKKLSTLNETDNTKPFLNIFSSIFSTDKTLTKLKFSLEKTIEKIDKKIIVFIDDLDRLDNSEVIEVLKLIRNTANFKNTFFIVGYDKNYVINALTNYNSYNKEGFLEKIFQLEINLPLYDSNELTKELFKNLSFSFPDKKNHIHRVLFTKENEELSISIHENINNMRDVVLISNSLIINYENLKGNVDFKDLLLIEILRVKFSYIYEILKNNKSQFIEKANFEKGRYTLKPTKDNNFFMFDLLDSNYNELNVDVISKEKIKSIISILFNTRPNYLSITNVSKYDNYFSYRLTEKTLDENEFIIIRKEKLSIIQDKISLWINKGYEFDLLKRFYAINKFYNSDDYKKIIRAIFFLAEHKSHKSENFIGFDAENLFLKLCYSEEFKTINFSVEKHKNFIKSIFITKKTIHSFKSNILHLFITNADFKNKSSKFPFDSNELLKISETQILNYTNKVKIINIDIIPILKSNSIKTNKIDFNNDFKYEYSESIKQLVIKYLDKQKVDSIILVAIQKTNKYMAYSISIEILNLFGSKKTFLNYLENKPNAVNSKYLEEFKKFEKAMNNFSQNNATNFQFEIIPV